MPQSIPVVEKNCNFLLAVHQNRYRVEAKDLSGQKEALLKIDTNINRIVRAHCERRYSKAFIRAIDVYFTSVVEVQEENNLLVYQYLYWLKSVTP